MPAPATLTVAVTGPTGTLGSGLLPLLEADDRVRRVVGIARRPFDPGSRGWSKLEYRRGDVRDADALAAAFADADVAVHLAFRVIGGDRATSHSVNVDGTLNAYRAAAAAGAERFVYTSSVAAYGFHADNPPRIAEDWPTRPAARLRYSQEKAELEHLLREAAATRPGPSVYLLRPSLVVGPHTLGGKDLLPGPLSGPARRVAGRIHRLPLPVPALVPDVPLQLVHEDDVGRALLLCTVGAGPPGAYNIAGNGVLSLADVARELGVVPVRVPTPVSYASARAITRLPLLPSRMAWVEALSHPVLMDTTQARTRLGWAPHYSGLEALRAALAD